MKSKKAILSCLVDWSNATTLHGVGNLARSQNTLILIARVCLFLASLAFFLYSFTKTVIDFSSLRIDTYLSHKIPDNGISFPAVTICNLKYLNTGKNPELNTVLTELMKAYPIYLQESATDSYGLDKFYDYGFRGYRSVLSSLDRNQPDWFFNRIKDMLLSCTFSISECFSTDFAEVFSDEYGKCFTFNSEGSKKIIKEGNKYGLRLEFLVGNMSMFDPSKKHGIRLFLHSPQENPPFDNGILVAAGSETDIEISETNYVKLSHPYSNCIQDPTSYKDMTTDLSKRTFSWFQLYSKTKCNAICLNDFVFKNTTHNMLQFRNASEQVTPEQSYAIQGVVNQFYQQNNETRYCKQQCPITCTYTEYSATTSQALYPTVFYQDFLKDYFSFKNGRAPFYHNFTDFGDLQSSSLAVNIFYKGTDVTHIEENPVNTFNRFLSDVGGILGLCLGASLLTLSEIIELIIYLCYVKLFPKKIPAVIEDLVKEATQMETLERTFDEKLAVLNLEIQTLKEKISSQVTPVNAD